MINIIYITGDKHGNFTDVINFCNTHNTTIDDILIILGDTGINYYGDKRDKKLKLQLSKLPITIFCIHGNHENRPRNILSYLTKIWNKGLVYVQEDYPNILFAENGEIFNLNGKDCLVLGGAYSVDKYYRLTRGFKWFEDEQLTNQEQFDIELKLDYFNWETDYVLSHTVPIMYEPREWFLDCIDQSTVDNSMEIWLNRIYNGLTINNKWYCGHYHGEKKIDNIEFMYNTIKVFE